MTAKSAIAICLLTLLPAGASAHLGDRLPHAVVRAVTSPRVEATTERMELPRQALQLDASSTPLQERGDQGLHPALGDGGPSSFPGKGYLVAAHEYYPSSPADTAHCKWCVSDTDGLLGWWCYYFLLEGTAGPLTYPSVDYWGDNSTFYGTAVCPVGWQGGGATLIVQASAIEPGDLSGSAAWYWDNQGYSNMKMADIACNNSIADWHWGALATILDHEGTGAAVPCLMQQINEAGTAALVRYILENCNSTTIDIDPVTLQAYAAWDCYNADSLRWELIVDHHDVPSFPDGVIEGWSWWWDDPRIQTQHPVVAAYGDKVLIVTENWPEGSPDSLDLVCWYTHTGQMDQLEVSLVAGSDEPECCPRIQHLQGDGFLCTYVKNDALHATVTWDGGVTWQDSVIVSGTDVVVPEYRTEDIAEFEDSAVKIIWEYSADDEIGLRWNSYPCPPPPLAVCCVQEECTLVTQSDCDGLGGEWHAYWGSCDPNPCEQPPAVCCVQEECSITTQGECEDLGGTWHSSWGSCDPNPCFEQGDCADYGGTPPPEILGSVDTPGSARGSAVWGDFVCVADGDRGLQVVDVTDPASPHIEGGVDTPGSAYMVAVSGTHAYVADYSTGLQVIDIANPASPQIVASVDTHNQAFGVTVSGAFAYVADGYGGLRVIDISNPLSPHIEGSADTDGAAYGVAVSGSYAYIADQTRGLKVIDVANPASPHIVGSVDTPQQALDVSHSGHYAFVADGISGLQVIDIANPAAPVIVASLDTPSQAMGVAVLGNYAYLADYESGLHVVDIAIPTSPQFIGSVDTPGLADKVTVAYSHAYVGDGASGLQILPVQCMPSKVGSDDPAISAMRLRAFPNPGCCRALIDFRTRHEGAVRTSVYDHAGRLVRELLDGTLPAGDHELRWDGRDQQGRAVPTGIYMIRITAGEEKIAGRLVVVR